MSNKKDTFTTTKVEMLYQFLSDNNFKSLEEEGALEVTIEALKRDISYFTQREKEELEYLTESYRDAEARMKDSLLDDLELMLEKLKDQE